MPQLISLAYSAKSFMFNVYLLIAHIHIHILKLEMLLSI